MGGQTLKKTPLLFLGGDAVKEPEGFFYRWGGCVLRAKFAGHAICINRRCQPAPPGLYDVKCATIVRSTSSGSSNTRLFSKRNTV